MKFKLIEDINRGHEDVSSNELLTEGDNTNLRKFLLALVEMSGVPLNFTQPVIHHTKKDRNQNGLYDLVLMENSDHCSMHNRYRYKVWNNNAHKDYEYMEVPQILDALKDKLTKESYKEEVILNSKLNN